MLKWTTAKKKGEQGLFLFLCVLITLPGGFYKFEGQTSTKLQQYIPASIPQVI